MSQASTGLFHRHSCGTTLHWESNQYGRHILWAIMLSLRGRALHPHRSAFRPLVTYGSGHSLVQGCLQLQDVFPRCHLRPSQNFLVLLSSQDIYSQIIYVAGIHTKSLRGIHEDFSPIICHLWLLCTYRNPRSFPSPNRHIHPNCPPNIPPHLNSSPLNCLLPSCLY